MKSVRANQIILTKRCEFACSLENAWVPMGHCRVSDLGERMDSLCGDSVVIEFRSSIRHEAEDKAKFSARLNTVPGWRFSEWHHPVIRGYVIETVWQCVATRDETACAQNVVDLCARRDNLVKELEAVQASCGNGHNVKKLVRLSEEIESIETEIAEFTT